jgi:hypothetical protein
VRRLILSQADHIAASLDQASGSFNQLLRTEGLGEHGNLFEGLWESLPAVSGDKHEWHQADAAKQAARRISNWMTPPRLSGPRSM